MAGPRDTKRYTEQQIQALMHSMLIAGHTPAQTVRLAAAGQLGIPAFQVDGRYIYQLRDNNRDTFEAENPEALAKATQQALIKAHKLNLDALRTLANDADPAERTRLAKSVADTQRLLATPKQRETREPQQHDAPKQGASEAVKQDDNTLSSLLTLAKNGTNDSTSRIRSDIAHDDGSVGAGTGSLARSRIEPDAA